MSRAGEPEARITVGVVVARRRLSNPWADHAWLPTAVLPAAPETPAWTRLSATQTEELFYAGPYELALHPSETAHYRDNLASGQPSLWVALRPIGGEDHEIAAVTADPYEGEGLAEGIGEIVEAVPMPTEIRDHLAAYVAAFHVERAFFKRRNDRPDAEALARRAPGRDRTGGEG
ncbi:DUF3305 domain-containing protein [Enterovirga aerilata]|uniref:DUF3305 domain-containing protein n=1 Tax=Enterovirga aerilata TaxID=2730920 RepID=A0A849IC09_9HYPH|nr:DUF3305 domain-containing protein [Enterovirga sp. DB1703]NNM74811.1 DUF3305 domain-containing protein [Enterovirga sp. DB1703]